MLRFFVSQFFVVGNENCLKIYLTIVSYSTGLRPSVRASTTFGRLSHLWFAFSLLERMISTAVDHDGNIHGLLIRARRSLNVQSEGLPDWTSDAWVYVIHTHRKRFELARTRVRKNILSFIDRTTTSSCVRRFQSEIRFCRIERKVNGGVDRRKR